MKKKILIVGLATIGSLSACKKNENPQPTNAIVGTWDEKKLHITKTSSDGTVKEITQENAHTYDYFTFYADSKAKRSQEAPGYLIDKDWLMYLVAESYTYNVSGTNLQLVKSSGITETETIIKVDSRNLILKDSYTYYGDQIVSYTYYEKE